MELQWDESLLNQPQGPTLQLPEVRADQAGLYSVAVSNYFGVVTNGPVALSVIAPVQRHWVPRVLVSGQPGTAVSLESTDALQDTAQWQLVDQLTLGGPSDWVFDLSDPLPTQRFYRASHTNGSVAVELGKPQFSNAIQLSGTPGTSVLVEGIERFGPIDAWFNVATVVLTNSPQVYFDMGVTNKEQRLYRITPVP